MLKEKHFTAFSTLTTPRLRLRAPRPDDAEAVVHHFCDWETVRMLARVPFPYTAADWDQFLAVLLEEKDELLWVMDAVAGEQTMGLISIAVEEDDQAPLRMGFWLGSAYRRQGYMSEAVAAVCDLAFGALNQEAISAGYFDDNTASASLQRKLGFEPVDHGQTHCVATGEARAHTDTILRPSVWDEIQAAGR